jgi:hypothetical protein
MDMLLNSNQNIKLPYFCPEIAAPAMFPAFQHRGSLHAHILLWVDPNEMPQVSQEITATKCRYKAAPTADGTVAHKPDLSPADTVANDLFNLV